MTSLPAVAASTDPPLRHYCPPHRLFATPPPHLQNKPLPTPATYIRIAVLPPPLFFCPPLMDDWGKPLRRAASAAKPPAPLQVALSRCPPKKTKRACAGPRAVTLPGEGSGGDGVKAQAGQGRAGGVVNRKRCEHGMQRSGCKDCGGGGICQHGRRRSRCKDCEGKRGR